MAKRKVLTDKQRRAQTFPRRLDAAVMETFPVVVCKTAFNLAAMAMHSRLKMHDGGPVKTEGEDLIVMFIAGFTAAEHSK